MLGRTMHSGVETCNFTEAGRHAEKRPPLPLESQCVPSEESRYVTCMGWAICIFVALCYLCFPIFAYFSGHDFSGPSIGVNGSD